MPRLVGPLNENLRLVEDAFEGTSIHARGNEFTIDGDDAALAARLVDELRLLLEQGQPLDPQVVHRTIDMVRADERPSEVLTAEVLRSARGRSVRPKTSGQKRYADAIRDSIVTFGVGPAGTGQELSGGGPGGAVPAGQAGRPDHPDPPGGRGRRAARFPARRPDGQDRPLPAARSTTPSTTCSAPKGPAGCSTPAPSRWRRWPICGAARSTTASSSSTRPRTPRPSR